MPRAEQFYDERHKVEENYSAGEYYLPSLFSLPAVSDWAKAHSQRETRLLDVGCGKGLFLRDFAKGISARWQVRDIAATGIDVVRSQGDLFSEVSSKFDFIQQNLDDQPLPLSDKSYDFVCCNQVLEHIFETEKLVREFRRVLRPDGLCLISVPNLSAWINRVLFLFASQPLGSEVGTERVTYGFWPRIGQRRLALHHPSGHIRDFTPRGLRDLTEHCGFETVGWWSQSHGLAARLSKWGGRGIGILLKPNL